MKPLQGKVTVLAGATRGAGRGIACMLGEAGAIVYCTGRSIRGKPATGNRPETIEETAEMVSAHGGIGIHVQIDHTIEEQVEELFSQVKAEQHRLDVLVNDVWGGDELTEWGKMFWEHSSQKGLLMFQRAIHSHIITSRFAVPLMIEGRDGLIFEITDGDHFGYRLNLYYDLVKISIIRLAFAMAKELRKHSITALAVTPGYMRSEAVLDHWGVTGENWQDGVKKDPHFIASETPFYVDRAVAALASDPEVSKKSGRVFSSWDLALEYGFTDVDGRQPVWSRYVEELTGKQFRKCDEAFYIEYWSQGPLDVLFPDWPSRSEIY